MSSGHENMSATCRNRVLGPFNGLETRPSEVARPLLYGLRMPRLLHLSLATAAAVLGFSSSAVAEPASGALEPEANTFELGLFGGLFVASERHEMYDFNLPHRRFDRPSPDFGLRAGYLFNRYFGLEAEGALLPLSIEGGGSGLGYNVRGHFLIQAPGRITPFAVVGGGALGFESSRTTGLGDDLDPEFHWGLGAKAYLTDLLSLRLDGRHIVAPSLDVPAVPENNGIESHFEILLGLGFTFGRTERVDEDPDRDGVVGRADRCPGRAGPAPRGCPDEDGDGIDDLLDRCPSEPGTTPNGCPVQDADGDGLPDEEDACPNAAGPAATRGCPDGDGDGMADASDACPAAAGVAPDGCPPPPPDADGDGVLDAEDACPEAPETRNDFQDEDGCPDEIPAAVKRFTGVIENITFRSGSARLRPSSFPTLKKVGKVLKTYPSVRLEIDGHTDNTGDHDKNVALSKARAQAVKNYLVGRQGVAADRLTVDGFGPDRPAATNATRAGRAQNRRIEFKLIQKNEAKEEAE